MTPEEKVRLLWERFVHQDQTFTVQTEITDEQGHKKWLHLRQFDGFCPHNPRHRRGSCPDLTPLPLTGREIAKHLVGTQTVGVYQLKENTVKWVCFDIDIQKGAEVDPADAPKQVARLQASLDRWHIPYLIENSGSRGVHIWLFFTEPVQASHALAFGRFLLQDVAVIDGFGIELFPKQAIAHNLGNVVKLPLGIHRKTGNRCFLMDHNHRPIADPWAALASVGTIGPQSLARFLATHKIDPKAFEPSPSTGRTRALPCFVNIIEQGASEGSRDEVTFRLACYLRASGLSFEMVLGALQEWNRLKNEPPLYDSELQAKVESAFSRDYSFYPCQSRTFDKYCDPNCPLYPSKLATRRNRGGTSSS